MDLPTLSAVHPARERADLAALGVGVAPLAGGTWLYSEPQDHLTGLVDLTTLGWTPWELTADGDLVVAATCTMAQLVAIPPLFAAQPLFRQHAESLLQSFKVWNTATIGGNIATALAAGALIGLCALLDAEAVVWGAGEDRVQRVADLVLAQRETTLAPDEVIRSLVFPAAALDSRAAFRRIALSPLGRVGTAVGARRDADGTFVLAVTGGTNRPEVLRYPDLPEAGRLAADVGALPTWFTDAHGAADWRRAMSTRFALDLLQDVA